MTRSRIAAALLAAALLLCLVPLPSLATPEFSERTAQSCGTCHLDEDGGELALEGLEFAASGYVWPPRGGYRVLGPVRKKVRFLIGLFHIVAAFIWFGTILYVHLMLRPAYAIKGLPGGRWRSAWYRWSSSGRRAFFSRSRGYGPWTFSCGAPGA